MKELPFKRTTMLNVNKIILVSTVLSLISFFMAGAQDRKEEYVDSVIYIPAAAVDSSLVGRDIFSLLPSKSKGDAAEVTVSQPQTVADALKKHISENPSRSIQGYRVRIFFDNSRNARKDSETTLKKFMTTHPGVPAYRSYQNPYFKVTVGDFRSRSEALELLEKIKAEFPSAFVLKESIRYPAVDKDNEYTSDTVKVIKRIWQER